MSPNHCCQCGTPRGLNGRVESWSNPEKIFQPNDHGRPLMPGRSEIKQSMIVSAQVYRNGGTCHETTHVCADCLRVCLVELRRQIDEALGEIAKNPTGSIDYAMPLTWRQIEALEAQVRNGNWTAISVLDLLARVQKADERAQKAETSAQRANIEKNHAEGRCAELQAIVDGEKNECGGDPDNCPENEGYGCACSAKSAKGGAL